MLDMFLIHTGYLKEAMQLILKETGLNSQAARDPTFMTNLYHSYNTDIVLKLIDATPLGEV